MIIGILSGSEITEKKTGSLIIHPKITRMKISRPRPNFLVPTISILLRESQKRKIKAVKEYSGEDK
jgi:hypothetical protein